MMTVNELITKLLGSKVLYDANVIIYDHKADIFEVVEKIIIHDDGDVEIQ